MRAAPPHAVAGCWGCCVHDFQACSASDRRRCMPHPAQPLARSNCTFQSSAPPTPPPSRATPASCCSGLRWNPHHGFSAGRRAHAAQPAAAAAAFAGRSGAAGQPPQGCGGAAGWRRTKRCRHSMCSSFAFGSAADYHFERKPRCPAWWHVPRLLIAAAAHRRPFSADSATQKLRQVAIPVLVLGPDHSTMHVAFDEACAHQQRCAGGGACACAECQAAALAVAPSCTPADAAPAVAASEVEQPAAAGQGQQAERQQRRWWRRAAAAPAPASAAVAAAAPLPPASTAGACVPPVSTPAQAAGGAGNPGASGASSASSSSPDPSTGGQPGNPRSLVRWVRCAESHSVLSVADLPPPEAQHDEPGSPL
jgi:hypothetical protein